MRQGGGRGALQPPIDQGLAKGYAHNHKPAFNRWDEIVRDKVLAAALVDRLTHKAYLVNMNGESYRLKETQKLIDSNERRTE